MLSKTVVITNESGLHTRPGNVFVKKAKEFDAAVFVEGNGKKVKGTSLLKLLSLGLKKGHEATVSAEGAQAEAAVAELSELLATLQD
jgi:phosphocarrier protein HPr